MFFQLHIIFNNSIIIAYPFKLPKLYKKPNSNAHMIQNLGIFSFSSLETIIQNANFIQFITNEFVWLAI